MTNCLGITFRCYSISSNDASAHPGEKSWSLRVHSAKAYNHSAGADNRLLWSRLIAAQPKRLGVNKLGGD
jgi:hypothetical protein